MGNFRDFVENKKLQEELSAGHPHIAARNHSDVDWDKELSGKSWSHDDLKGLMDPDEPVSKPKMAMNVRTPLGRDKVYMHQRHAPDYVKHIRANTPAAIPLRKPEEDSEWDFLANAKVDNDSLRGLLPRDHQGYKEPPVDRPFQPLHIRTMLDEPEDVPHNIDPTDKTMLPNARQSYMTRASRAGVPDDIIKKNLGTATPGAAKSMLNKSRRLNSQM